MTVHKISKDFRSTECNRFIWLMFDGFVHVFGFTLNGCIQTNFHFNRIVVSLYFCSTKYYAMHTAIGAWNNLRIEIDRNFGSYKTKAVIKLTKCQNHQHRFTRKSFIFKRVNKWTDTIHPGAITLSFFSRCFFFLIENGFSFIS